MSIAAIAVSLTLASTSVAGPGYYVGDGDYLDTVGWSVQFYDTYSRDKLASTVRLTAAELKKNTGVDIAYTSTINKTSAQCPGYTSTGRHRIVIRLEPSNTRSYTYACTLGDLRTSASVHMSGVNWTNKLRAGTHTAYRENVISHELGHAVGLGHPTPCNLTGTDPLMCGDYWGGYSTPSTAMKYTPYDIAGLKKLVTNRP
jgi:hypothetical protein